jgi:hypothetical protein
MPQNRDSGDRARKWGYDMAQKVANYLGAILTNPQRSNEALLGNRRILIKSAHYGNPQIGATLATLNRVSAVIAALQDKDRDYSLYEVPSNRFLQHTSPSRSPKASHVMMVNCSEVREAGNMLGRIKEP